MSEPRVRIRFLAEPVTWIGPLGQILGYATNATNINCHLFLRLSVNVILAQAGTQTCKISRIISISINALAADDWMAASAARTMWVISGLQAGALYGTPLVPIAVSLTITAF